MRTRGRIAIVSVVILCGLRVGALQTAPTETEYDADMKEIRLSLGDAEGHIDARYWPETEEAGAALAQLFERVQAFWEARDTAAAAEIAGTAIAASRALRAAAAQNDYDAARAAFGDLRDTCAACHRDYREETEDGYRVKPAGG